MNPEKNNLTEEQIEIEEQSIGEPMNVLEQEEEDRLTQEKIRENADSELNDLREEDASFGERE